MSDGIMQGPDRSTDIRELIDLLAKLFDDASQLPPGSEKAQAIKEILGYERRLRALLQRTS